MLAQLSSELHKAFVLIGIVDFVTVIALTLILVTSIFCVCRGLLQFFRFRKPRGVRCPEQMQRR